MNLVNRAVAGAILGLALIVGAGCSDNIALVGRSAPPLAQQEEIFAEINRIDSPSRRLYLRLDNGRDRVVDYSADTRVFYRGREYSVVHLESGDRVSMQLQQDSRGNFSTNSIRLQESIQDRNQTRSGAAGPGSAIQTLDGRVEQLDLQRGSFEIRHPSRERVIVSLPGNAQRSDVDRFRALRDGDYVRFEGRFLDRQRFELATFLRDNR